MTNEMIITPFNDLNSVKEVYSAEDMLTCDETCFYRIPHLLGSRSSANKKMFDGLFFALPGGRMVFDQSVLYITNNNHFFPMAYPMAWPYQKFIDADGHKLRVRASSMPTRKLSGTWYAPMNLGVDFHLYHNLYDNYCRMAYMPDLKGALPPVVIPVHGPMNKDVKSIHDLFVGSQPNEIVTRGVYEFDKLVIPPLGNKDNFIFDFTTQFLSQKLMSMVKKSKRAYASRIYVSRADASVRTLVNEGELVEALTALGFVALCPGEYNVTTQMDIFASAEIIIGIHGMGLMPMLVSRNCKAVFEYEAQGWRGTAFSGIAANLGIHYERLPCTLVDHNRNAVADWTARADIPATIQRIRAVLDLTGGPVSIAPETGS